jgi:hypothetical protein
MSYLIIRFCYGRQGLTLNRYIEHAEFRKKEPLQDGAPVTEFISSSRLIALDVARTFTLMDVIQFKYNYATTPQLQPLPATIFRDELIQVLESFTLFRPAVGYVRISYSENSRHVGSRNVACCRYHLIFDL